MNKFTATLEGTTKTGIEVPAEVVEALASGKKPAVVLTVNGYTYRTTVAVMGGRYLVPMSAAHREAAGLAGGDTVEVEIELDEKPREVVVPADFGAALAAEPKARAFFDGLSFSQRNWFVLGIEEAKKPETRAARIVKAVERLASGRGQR
ncbi:YdeI/OmpD-associated family protein [Kribbella sp. CA-293567]|uniref:YdeI/OmpD-associated family protein n=1 Tax=Kribbella sp. CA-293567 TaxID=3002436 RepID=UPI0022DD7118|nr:YdeI/OmpD-associated family protein [Kribbella sp. CA-293567]WBQ06660.1 YdeI/OmpD-associated family protein [Kribbella sp. CA-293567]